MRLSSQVATFNWILILYFNKLRLQVFASDPLLITMPFHQVDYIFQNLFRIPAISNYNILLFSSEFEIEGYNCINMGQTRPDRIDTGSVILTFWILYILLIAWEHVIASRYKEVGQITWRRITHKWLALTGFQWFLWYQCHFNPWNKATNNRFKLKGGFLTKPRKLPWNGILTHPRCGNLTLDFEYSQTSNRGQHWQSN